MSEVIALPAGTRIWLAAGVTDMRCYAVPLVMRIRSEFLSPKPRRLLFAVLDYFA